MSMFVTLVKIIINKLRRKMGKNLILDEVEKSDIYLWTKGKTSNELLDDRVGEFDRLCRNSLLASRSKVGAWWRWLLGIDRSSGRTASRRPVSTESGEPSKLNDKHGCDWWSCECCWCPLFIIISQLIQKTNKQNQNSRFKVVFACKNS